MFAALRDLEGLRLQLAFRDAAGGPDARVRWHDIRTPALEAIPAGPGPEPAIEPYVDIYYLRLDGELSHLHRAAEPRDELPPDTALPGQAQLRVAADDAQSWQTVTAALTRGCRGVQLIEPARVPTRKPDATSILDPPRPPRDPFGPPSVRQAQPRVQGPLPRDIVRRIVRAHINEVRYCYLRGLNKNPELRGRVTVEFTIDGNGKVSRSQVQASTVADAEVAQCTAIATRRWNFPRPDGAEVVVTQAFTLAPP
ncbi:AgmX/PglI C-terminal domain-containing protein [Nannocystis sp.]|uniref:AgmX/PglI C-terminal domain-containing protein n=1 Tax=Nannocystis sp. TaxID=1962667 RepID=UPI0025CD7C80|nr:AgmX/PglI C-terminal domain-containing protein [Nannocystis sp.]MBK7829276.1 energy transducer TonB [Nannocystis sp.]